MCTTEIYKYFQDFKENGPLNFKIIFSKPTRFCNILVAKNMQ